MHYANNSVIHTAFVFCSKKANPCSGHNGNADDNFVKGFLVFTPGQCIATLMDRPRYIASSARLLFL